MKDPSTGAKAGIENRLSFDFGTVFTDNSGQSLSNAIVYLNIAGYLKLEDNVSWVYYINNNNIIIIIIIQTTIIMKQGILVKSFLMPLLKKSFPNISFE